MEGYSEGDGGNLLFFLGKGCSWIAGEGKGTHDNSMVGVDFDIKMSWVLD